MISREDQVKTGRDTVPRRGMEGGHSPGEEAYTVPEECRNRAPRARRGGGPRHPTRKHSGIWVQLQHVRSLEVITANVSATANPRLPRTHQSNEFAGQAAGRTRDRGASHSVTADICPQRTETPGGKHDRLDESWQGCVACTEHENPWA